MELKNLENGEEYYFIIAEDNETKNMFFELEDDALEFLEGLSVREINRVEFVGKVKLIDKFTPITETKLILKFGPNDKEHD